jgi:hypothetical protein
MSIPAAWYADPADARNLRYWDGAAWTNNVAPAPAPAVDPVVGAAEAGAGAGGSSIGNFHGGYDPAAQDRQSFSAYGVASNSYGSSGGGAGSYGAGPYDSGSNQLSRPSYSAPSTQVHSTGSIGRSVWGIALGLFVIGGAVVTIQAIDAANAPAAGSLTANGTVAALDFVNNGCSPEVNFMAGDTQYLIYSTISINPCPWHVGETVPVSYVPGNEKATATVTDSASTMPITAAKYGSIAIGSLIVLRNAFGLYRRSTNA